MSLLLPLHKCKFTLDRAHITHSFILGYNQMKIHVLSNQPCITFCYSSALSTDTSLPVQETRQGDEAVNINLRIRVRKHIFITKSALENPLNCYHPIVSKTHYCCSFLKTATWKSGLPCNFWLISCLSQTNRRKWVCDLEQKGILASPAPRLGETMFLLTWAFTFLEKVSVICLSIWSSSKIMP